MEVIPKIKEQLIKFHEVRGLMRYFNIERMNRIHQLMKEDKAAGVDNIDKQNYDDNLAANLNNLLNKMKRFEYYPKPVRRARIPKANGKVRELGIPSYEDKIVQKIMADILNNIYEPIFLDCSYGFRPGKNCHQALIKICESVYKGKVNYVIETDIKGFFDNVNQEVLIRILEITIKDRHFMEYVRRFLKAGIMDKEILKPSEIGTPQGGNISPILANVYLHYALDQWFENEIKPKAKGECCLVRYADDFVMMFEDFWDSEKVYNNIRKRMKMYGLELQEEKTRKFEFNLKRASKINFDFLGFNIYNYRDIHGNVRLGMKIKEDSIQKKYDNLKEHIELCRDRQFNELRERVNSILGGYYSYYGVSTNLEWLISIYQYAVREMLLIWIERNGVPRDPQYFNYIVKTVPVLQPYKYISIYL